jgi:probable H4MPT-linked C1 transfer pathway protein
MQNKSINKTIIGWDIGGAHIKYCVISDNSNIIWYDIMDFEFWNEYKDFKNILIEINSIYKKKNYHIENYFTMSAEMCDCFNDRNKGVEFIINEIIKSNCTAYIFTKNGFLKASMVKKSLLKAIGSFNWYATALYIASSFPDVIAIDFGSTTCDFIIIKNGKIKNKRTSDITGLQSRELLYSGCSRTPIYSHINKINYKKNSYTIIPEQFSSMSDIYIILDKLSVDSIYSKTSNNSDHTKINAYKRISRSFGFDFTNKKLDLVKNLSKKIYNNQIKLIENYILFHQKKYFKNSKKLNIMGIGLGHRAISYISSKNHLNYIDINNILETNIHNGSDLTKLFSSYVMCRINK